MCLTSKRSFANQITALQKTLCFINKVHFFAMKTIWKIDKAKYSTECDINAQKILHTIKMLHVNKPYIKSGEYSAESLKP